MLGLIGRALGFARALVGFAGAADGAASSICNTSAIEGFGITGSGVGRSGVGTGAADGLALARGGPLLVRSRLGRWDEYRTIAAGAVGAGSDAGVGSAGAGGGAGGGGGGGRGIGALSYGIRLDRERPRRTAPTAGGGGGPELELDTCISSGSFGGVAMLYTCRWLCCWWWVVARSKSDCIICS